MAHSFLSFVFYLWGKCLLTLPQVSGTLTFLLVSASYQSFSHLSFYLSLPNHFSATLKAPEGLTPYKINIFLLNELMCK
jgi:hypothetical protein